MLSRIGNFVRKKPMLVIVISLLITSGFATLLPFMKAGTSIEDFLPDNEQVRANDRIEKYFGAGYSSLMIHANSKRGNSIASPEALREEYLICKELEKEEGVAEVISVANFVNIVCQMEYGKPLMNCSDNEIANAFHDLISEESKSIGVGDGKDASFDFADIKNFSICREDDEIFFSIYVYDLSKLENFKPFKAVEWYISFRNEIVPDERLNISYRISARIEPPSVWEIGKGLIENMRNVFQSIASKEFFNYEEKAYIWIKPKGYETYFPIPLETGNVTLDFANNRVTIKVQKKELEKFGIAPEMGGAALPAKLGSLKAETRIYSMPTFRLSLSIKFIKNFFEGLRNVAMLNELTAKLLDKYANATWEDFEGMLDMMEDNESFSLKDFDELWSVIDEAPNGEFASLTFLIKPSFMEKMRESSLTFLPSNSTYNADETVIIVQIYPEEEERLKEINKKLVNLVEGYDAKYVKMKATGTTVITYEIDELTEESNKIIAPSIFIAIIIILFLSFKKPSYVALPLAGLTISLLWLFGTMSLLGIKFNTLAVALVPLVMGLGVDYSVHMFHNYRVEIQKGKSPGEAITSSVKDVGKAMLLATITTCIGFLSFLTSSIPSIRNFGILCAIGIIYTFIVTITLLASIRYILDRKKMLEFSEKKISLRKMMERLSAIILKKPKTILFAIMLVTILMTGGALNLKTTFSMEDFVPENSASIKTMKTIYENFPFSSQQQEYILIEGDVASLKALEGVYETHENAKDDEFVIMANGEPKLVSILSLIREVAENNTLAERFHIGENGLPETDEDVKEIYDYLYENYEQDAKMVLHKNGNKYDALLIRVYVNPSVNENNKNMELLYTDLNDDLSDYGNARAIITGETTLTYTITKSLTESQLRSTLVCLILAGIVVILAYRKLLLGIVATIPVALSAIWILGTIYFVGYSLNVMTVMITSLTIGLGITYAIHAVERYRLVKERTGDDMEAIADTVKHTGQALMMAAVTTIAGFGMLIFSPIPPEQQFGVVTATTILYSFIITILVVPSLLLFWVKKRT